MQLVRREWDPIQQLAALNERFERMFDFLRPNATGDGREAIASTTWMPAVDIAETDDAYRICADLPGVDKQNVAVTLDDGVLMIRGERHQEKNESNARYHRREAVYGTFMRQFSLPDDAYAGKVDATFKDGILEVTIGKTKDRPSKMKQIDVH